MTSDFSGGGDLRRTIELLWGAAEPGRRGPKPRRSVEEIVAAAVALADKEGVAALSMRRVAEAVGLSPMSLYTYLPSKAELLDLMLDRLWGEMADPPAELAGWRERLEFIAREQWRLGLRHPWTLQIAAHRPPLGPNLLQRAEASMRAMDGLGLTAVEMDQVLHLIRDYVRGAVRTAVEADEVERRTGVTDEQWWRLNEPLLQGLIRREDYPALTRVGAELQAAGTKGGARLANFEFGLQRVLDGVAALVAARGGQAASAGR